MKYQIISKIVLLSGLLLWSACQEKPGSTDMVVVGNNGVITLFGKNITLEDLKTALLDSLVKMPSIPENIDVRFGDEILMGMRGEVETEVGEAIIAARESQRKPVVVNRMFYREKGTDCSQPDTLRTNCAVVNFNYPTVYYKEGALKKNVDSWVNSFLAGILKLEDNEKANAPAIEPLDEAVKVFFNNHESYKGSAMYGAFVADCSTEVLLNDGHYLTLEIDGYTFQGGAHGSPVAIVATFDVHTGKQLTWDDLVSDKAALQALAEKKFRAERVDAFEDGFEFDEIFTFNLPVNYGLLNSGIYFHFLPYEVGPYAIGSTTFVLPFAEIDHLIKIDWRNEFAEDPIDSGGSQDHPDLIAINNTIHDFYIWYNKFQEDEKRNIDFVNAKGKHLKLDAPKLEQYFANLTSSGFISKEFVDNEKVFLKKCEALWQKQSKDEPPICLDADRFFCAQDWDLNYWTQAPIAAEGLETERAVATMAGLEGGSERVQKFELKKENGRWLITKIQCDML